MALRTPPGPLPIPGRLFRLAEDPLTFLTRLTQEHGSYVFMRIATRPVYVITEPDLIREVLVEKARSFKKDRGLQAAKLLLGEGLLTSEGEYHKRQRRLSQPAFHARRVAAYGTVMVDHTLRRQEQWRDGQVLDVTHEMMGLALSIVAQTLFGTSVEEETRDIGESLDTAIQMFHIARIPFAMILNKLPLPSTRRFQAARKNLDKVIFRMIRTRRESGDKGDLLSMLLLAQDTEGDGGAMTDEQLRDEAMTIFLAGHETTANALAWTLYLLSRHPEIAQRMHAEVDAVLDGKPATFEDVRRLSYTEMVFAESMRLYPPAWTMGRLAREEVEIGGYTAKKGAAFLMPQWVVHRDPARWPDPLRFDPERFTPEAKAGRHKFSYYPFGAGGRMCIGEAFAWMEGILVLATLAQRWSFTLVPGHQVVPDPGITLRQKTGLKMIARERNGAVMERAGKRRGEAAT